ncbi:MAG: DRTGG domain-containing protein [Candidatus Muirbacterium halophilum]|nr:DRTGG domain-containing protein [Candidatus Muirbacterium halophilum]MCK9475077.1 DRTGG domain-containing protein [Candidatus Muirbacterium halophilum]
MKNTNIKLETLKNILNAEVLTENFPEKLEICYFCCTELMSDVLAFTHEGDSTVLITALSNSQTLRTAEMVDIKVVVIVRGKTIDRQLIELAEENGITLLRTEEAMFEVAGKLCSHIKDECNKEKSKNG